MRRLNLFASLLLSAAIISGISCGEKSENKPTASGGGGGGAESAAPAPAAGGAKIVKASDPSALKLAFVTNNVSDFWKIAAAGVHKYEKEANVQVDIKMPPSAKTEEQNGYLENLVSQGYNGIAISVI